MRQAYVIEDGIPLPARTRGLLSPLGAAVRALDVGQSVMVPGATRKTGITGTVWAAGKLFGRKFATRTVEGGIRVWRLS